MTIKTYNNAELAALYNVSPKVWLRWIKPLLEKEQYEVGKKNGWYWQPKQVEIFVKHFGLPTKELFDQEQ